MNGHIEGVTVPVWLFMVMVVMWVIAAFIISTFIGVLATIVGGVLLWQVFKER